jgi:hypothetical protein
MYMTRNTGVIQVDIFSFKYYWSPRIAHVVKSFWYGLEYRDSNRGRGRNFFFTAGSRPVLGPI